MATSGRCSVALSISVLPWLADLTLYVAVSASFGLDTGIGGYLALERIGYLALGVSATAAGLGFFDGLTLVAVMGVDVPEALWTGYVIVVHAFVVVLLSLLGLFFLRSVVPARRTAALEPV